MKRAALYEVLAAGCLSLAGIAGALAAAGAALQQSLSVAASSLCLVLFLVPGLYFLAYARRLRTRDLALAYAAAFARSRETLRFEELAKELRVSPEEAARILRTAVREGHLRGRFVEDDHFISEAIGTSASEGES